MKEQREVESEKEIGIFKTNLFAKVLRSINRVFAVDDAESAISGESGIISGELCHKQLVQLENIEEFRSEMDRNREARRTTVNGLSRRRHRTSSLRDSPGSILAQI